MQKGPGRDLERAIAIGRVASALLAVSNLPAEFRSQAWELNCLRSTLSRWSARLQALGVTTEEVATVRLAIELDPSGDSMVVPITARSYVPPCIEAKVVAYARYCLEAFDFRLSAQWREKREVLRRLDEQHLLAESIAPQIERAVADRKARSQGGRKGGLAQHTNRDVQQKVAAHWLTLACRPERERSAVIAERLGITSTAVRQHVRSSGLRKAKEKLP